MEPSRSSMQETWEYELLICDKKALCHHERLTKHMWNKRLGIFSLEKGEKFPSQKILNFFCLKKKFDFFQKIFCRMNFFLYLSLEQKVWICH